MTERKYIRGFLRPGDKVALKKQTAPYAKRPYLKPADTDQRREAIQAASRAKAGAIAALEDLEFLFGWMPPEWVQSVVLGAKGHAPPGSTPLEVLLFQAANKAGFATVMGPKGQQQEFFFQRLAAALQGGLRDPDEAAGNPVVDVRFPAPPFGLVAGGHSAPWKPEARPPSRGRPGPRSTVAST